jgi:hypothetical protein
LAYFFAPGLYSGAAAAARWPQSILFGQTEPSLGCFVRAIKGDQASQF